MKQKEILQKLVDELIKRISNPMNIIKSKGYFNESLGKTSYLLAGILQLLMKKISDWDNKKWIDDSLLTDIDIKENHITIQGL